MMPTAKQINLPDDLKMVNLAISLTKLLGIAKLARLVELLEDVIDETGYGDVKIVVAEGKVQMLKAEHSYK